MGHFLRNILSHNLSVHCDSLVHFSCGPCNKNSGYTSHFGKKMSKIFQPIQEMQ